MTGDQTLIARVTSVTDANAWSKAGVMLRDNLPSTAGGGAGGEGSAMYVDMVATPGEGVSLQWRNATGAASDSDVLVATITFGSPNTVAAIAQGGMFYGIQDGCTASGMGISVSGNTFSIAAGTFSIPVDETTTYVYDSNLGLTASTVPIYSNELLRAVIDPGSSNTPQDVANASTTGYNRVEYQYICEHDRPRLASWRGRDRIRHHALHVCISWWSDGFWFPCLFRCTAPYCW